MPKPDDTTDALPSFAALYASINRASASGKTDEEERLYTAKLDCFREIEEVCRKYAGTGPQKRLSTYDVLDVLAVCIGASIKTNCTGTVDIQLLPAMQMYKRILEAIFIDGTK